ncbi:MAG: iron ABC transporter permease, partial [Parvibaculum sedimenti]|uniref:FecCD family ABC transporter permease n=1 Tax=Parvibaculum sedimenti TaxID=2608632 RepID=UPI003BB6A82D
MSVARVARPPALRRLPRAVLLGGLAMLLGLAFLLALGIGAMQIPAGEVLRVLFGFETDSQAAAIVLGLRLPRAVLAILVGAGLGISGAALQGLFRNPLADPGLIGISGGAALGAVSVIVLGHLLIALLPLAADPHLLPVAAFLGGLAATFATERLAHHRGVAATGILLLAGIAINAMAGAIMGVLIYSSDDSQLREITFWTMGSLAKGGWSGVTLSAPFVILAVLMLLRCAAPLNAMLLGEREAHHLGVSVERLKRVVMIAGALAVGASVAVSGIIAFVGVVVPHLVRMAAGPEHRIVLPGSALLGGTLLLVADSVARIIVVPAELPIGL